MEKEMGTQIKRKRVGSMGDSFSGKRVGEFVGEVKQELRRIDWTNKEELKLYTKIVLCSAFFFGMLIYCFDLVVQGALRGVQWVFSLFGG